MSYSHIDINLLPPELQPGPAVRYSLLINFAIIAIAIVLIGLDSFFGLTRLAQRKAEVQQKQEMIDSKQQVVKDYNSLINIQNEVDGIGRLVSLASDDYIDMPVVMDRIARIVPDGVFLERVFNSRRTAGSQGTTLQVVLLASQEDPHLIAEAFAAFKKDSIFHNCFLRVAEYEEHSLDQFLNLINANWSASGPDLDNARVANQFAFEINAFITPPVNPGSAVPEIDNSAYLTPFDLDAEPAGEAAQAPETGVVGAPEGVVPTEVH